MTPQQVASTDAPGPAVAAGAAEVSFLPPIKSASYLWGLALSVTAAAVVALGEIDAQSARVVVVDGRAWPFSALFAPFGDREAGWQEIVASGLLADSGGLLPRLLQWHLWIDLIFMIAYGAVLAGLVHAVFRAGWARVVAAILVAGTVVYDAVEDLLVSSLLRSGVVPPALSAITTAKWIALGCTAAMIIVRAVAPFSDPRPDDPRPTLRRTGRALMHHRFSVAFLVPLGVLTVLAGSAVLEQLPDVQRRWVTDGYVGLGHALAAVMVLSIAAVLLALLGRYRTGYAIRHPATGDPVPEEPGSPLLAVWLVGPAVAVVGGIVAGWGMDAPVLWGRLLIFCVVPLLVFGASLALRFAWRKYESRRVRDKPQQFTEVEIATIRFTGRALALTVLTIGGLGLIRSFTSTVVLRPELTAAPQGLTGANADEAAWLLALGVAAVVLPWLAMFVITAVRRRPEPREITSVGIAKPKRLWPRWLVLGGVLVTFFGVALHPDAVGRWGVSAVAIICLDSLIGIPAATGLLIQDRPTAEVFRFLGLHRTPLVSMLVIAVVLVGALSGQTTIHRVYDPARVTAGGVPAQGSTAEGDPRKDFDAVFDDWLHQDGCVIEVGGRRVRPMIMIAAEGGGIRAAYWTVKGLQAIEDGTAGKQRCGSRSVLFSGGASGGSVGLTVARFSGNATAPSAPGVAAVEQMARPAALAQGVIGTFVRDPFYGATGVPLTTDGVAPPRAWADRARLLEIGWSGGRDAESWGNKDFLAPDETLSPATGALVLNSTSVASQCRAWVSQVTLPQPTAPSGTQRCDQRDEAGPRSIDLVSAYVRAPDPNSQAVPAGCIGALRAATAAMLTARFPYVTPGGVVGPCPVEANTPNADMAAVETLWPRTQLIDGGYTENSGLATVADLSVSWLAMVRQHNEHAMTPPDKEARVGTQHDADPAEDELIVPIVVYLSNEQGQAGRSGAPERLQSELLVPPIEFLRGQGTLNTTSALLQRAANTVRTTSFCPEVQSSTVDCAAIAAVFPRRVIVVDRAAQPEVTAPLGWVLSQASMSGMNKAMQVQAATVCEPAGSDAAGGDTEDNEPSCVRGYGALGDLLGYLNR